MGLNAPVGNYGNGDPVWAFWPMGSAWLTQHLWEHYAFSGDEAFLRDKAYPIMKDAALFCLDWLIEDKDGYFITSPSTSPEHKFLVGDKCHAVSAASTIDLSLISELFDNCIKAAEQLKIDENLVMTFVETKQKLLPLQIGKHDRLQEWSKDFVDEDVHHRHVSHLVGIYPSNLLRSSLLLICFKQRKNRLKSEGTGERDGALAGKSAYGQDSKTAIARSG